MSKIHKRKTLKDRVRDLKKLDCIINWGNKIKIIVGYVCGLVLLLASYFAGYGRAFFPFFLEDIAP